MTAARAGGSGWSRALQTQWWRARPAPWVHALRPLSALYGALSALRRQMYAAGWQHSGGTGLPTIVVGNLVVGGAGKTPTVIALVKVLQGAGWRPGVLSRGYGGAAQAPIEVRPGAAPAYVGDEPSLIARRTGVPVWVGRARLAAAQAMRAAHPEVTVIVCDDGLQHAALQRDLSVIVFDERGCGNGRLLPAGPLREALPATLPPNTWLLYNAPRPSTPLPGMLIDRALGRAVPLGAWLAGDTDSAAASVPLSALRGRPLLAAAGIASPERFFAMLEASGLDITRLPLADHHSFDSLPWPAATRELVLTEKDAVKLAGKAVAGTVVWVVGLDFGLPEAFTRALLHRLSQLTAP